MSIFHVEKIPICGDDSAAYHFAIEMKGRIWTIAFSKYAIMMQAGRTYARDVKIWVWRFD